jgi:hypothetical protein
VDTWGFSGVKWPDNEADNSPASSEEVQAIPKDTEIMYVILRLCPSGM